MNRRAVRPFVVFFVAAMLGMAGSAASTADPMQVSLSAKTDPAPAALRGETTDLVWPTRHAAPPVALTPAQTEWLPAFRASLEWLPESAILSLALSQPRVLGLPPAEAEKLAPLLADHYAEIARDPDFAAVRGHLAYCFSAVRPSHGLARITIPASVDANTRALIFVHGQGGSFLWYHHWLKTAFPDHIIVSPAYGTNPANISAAYLDECRLAAEKKLGRRLDPPALIGISAGGFGVFRAYVTTPSRYRRAVVLAAYPPPDLHYARWRTFSIHVLAGADEYFVHDGTWRDGLASLGRSGAAFTAETVAGGNHFFLATHPAETRAWLARALSAPENSP